jgi:hypothetical protein
MTAPDKLTLIVPDESAAAGEPSQRPEDFEEQALPAWVPRVRLHRPKDVDLNKLQEGLDQMQGQIDALLQGVKTSTVAGFRLNSIEISLAISAGGSIGVATAGVEASMSLSFQRVSAP